MADGEDVSNLATALDSLDLSHSQQNAGDELFDFCCTPCASKKLNRQAIKLCLNCSEYYCTQCLENHKSFKALSTHVLTDPQPIQPATPQHGSPTVYAAPTEVCSKHHLKIVDMYCKDDKKVGCSACFLLEHKSCTDIHYVPELLVKFGYPSRHVNQINQNLTKEIKVMEKLMKNTQGQTLDKSKAKCKKEMLEYRKDINQILDKMEENTLAELDNVYKTTKTKVDDTNQDINDVHGKMVRLKSELDSNMSNECQKFVSATLGESLMMQGVELRSDFANAPKMELMFTRNTNIMEFLLRFATFGIVSSPENDAGSSQQQMQSCTGSNAQQKQYTTEPRRQQGQSAVLPDSQQSQSSTSSMAQQRQSATGSSLQQGQSPAGPDSQTNQSSTGPNPQKMQSAVIPDSQQRQSATGQQSLLPINAIEPNSASSDKPSTAAVVKRRKSDRLYKIVKKSEHDIREEDDEKTCNIWALCMVDDDYLLLGDYSNHKMKLVDSITYTLKSSLKMMNTWPWSIHPVNDKEVVVCRANKSLEFVAIEGDKLLPKRSINLFHLCRAIYVRNDTMYVCSNNVIYIYTLVGNLVMRIEKDKSGLAMFSNITDITSGVDGMLHVTDRKKGVITLNSDRTVAWVYPNSEITDARGVCTDKNGNVFVCGCNPSNVSQLSPDGQLIGRITARDQMVAPTAIFFDGNRNRLILGRNNCDAITEFILF